PPRSGVRQAGNRRRRGRGSPNDIPSPVLSRRVGGTGSSWSLSSRGAWPRRTTRFQDNTLSMVDFNLIDRIGVNEGEAEALIREALGDVVAEGNMDGLLTKDMEQLQVGKILKGTVVGKAGDDVVVEVGLKS